MNMPQLSTIQIGDHELAYLDNKLTSAVTPTIVMLPGWCGDHHSFSELIPQLNDTHRVVAVNWRGHAPVPHDVSDFGYAEQAQDALAILDAIGVDEFLPVSASHGGWALVQLLVDAGPARARAGVVLDWLMRRPTPEFTAALLSLQDPEGWVDSCRALFHTWRPNDSDWVESRVERAKEFGFDMWARSGRVISGAYGEHGTPLEFMKTITPERHIRHLFSTPSDSDYVAPQEAFASENEWFSYALLGGTSHFPHLEMPDRVAAHIVELAKNTYQAGAMR
ncbi:2-heptyl-3-hydroxy-4(1H)-quinolone (PQS) dioxygenase (plasmid) [Rhodococcus erythropolis]|uniref:2-heptyl-3-hydroxy-4-quinolone dioxygenase AqdC1 n=1 Tax=Rhodococcus erythropolis TaxID=1833 RepID=AQDC1_RHOER|nr:2-heptyl-3-hydroxy-4-quinolone dioxygenase AqdC1 [Rhodococcus erythropolis]A0A0E4AE72.1 RecName: Full=2-heptyl-3-hydroxy-4-quinolone dioxygenase AqdC1; Short=PQS dioxygenase [Rhodococcus erythropolis]AKE01130.1 2-heptyl-3-hydroxy-4(1H)-quinolone (PQS) dioxygenase [Rhodococcus erythropolis]